MWQGLAHDVLTQCVNTVCQCSVSAQCVNALTTHVSTQCQITLPQHVRYTGNTKCQVTAMTQMYTDTKHLVVLREHNASFTLTSE